ncbi:porin family protein [Agrilutibacter solisilvae]|uniref:Outer membrane beta-barrel protein n=1 Tax=Agrilutibacter solisilvae TaxID=2763317 RepID=A0A974XXN5_9GAMM|nr:outer membrane beta-barrel protein [Lysobacter solisilvae]QSX77676.1 outer membrane beta-barrel protein [Lysobacter solisilvae]
MLLAGLAGNAHAARLNYQIELSGLYSDNIDLSEDDQNTETVLIPRLLFDFKEEGSAVEVEARGQIERRRYLQNRYDNETRAEFAGQLNWTVIPQRLHFVAEDYLTEEPINFRDGRYPGNLQRVNIFIAGPSLFARMGPATQFQLDLRAADSQAEVATGFDGSRYIAAAVLQRDMTPTTTGSFHLTTTKAQFDDVTEAVDFKRHDGFVRLQGQRRDTEYELDLGYSRLDRELADDESMTIFRATVQSQLSSRSRLRFRLRHEFSDEVQDMVVRLSDPDEALIPDLLDVSSSLVSAGVYEQRAAELDYRYTGERVMLRLRPIYRRLSYLDRTDADRSERGIFFQADYRLRPLVTVFIGGSFRKRDFDSIDERDHDRVIRVGFDQQLSRHWGWRAEALRNERDSNLPDPRYKENAVQVTVWWKR